MKEITRQDYEERMLRVLIHIQRNLDQSPTLEELAEVAHFSPFHFHRIFRGMTGESLKAHVRRLRIEKAAGRLRKTDHPVIRIALDAGFESHAAFTRAFKTQMGQPPNDWRKAPRIALSAGHPGRIRAARRMLQLPHAVRRHRCRARALSLSLRGELAIANAKLAYQSYKRIFFGVQADNELTREADVFGYVVWQRFDNDESIYDPPTWDEDLRWGDDTVTGGLGLRGVMGAGGNYSGELSLQGGRRYSSAFDSGGDGFAERDDVKAWALNLNASYTFRQYNLLPRLEGQFIYGSGDKDAGNRGNGERSTII